MSDYRIDVADRGEFRYAISNGRAEVTTAWHPEPGAFQATELYLASLGACMLATLMYAGSILKLDLGGAQVSVTAHSASKPDRMVDVCVTYRLPPGLSDHQKASLIRAGDTCKVHATIASHEPMTVTIEDLPVPSLGRHEAAGQGRD